MVRFIHSTFYRCHILISGAILQYKSISFSHLGDSLLNTEDAILLLELLQDRVVDLAVHGSQDTLLRQGTVENLLDSGHTHEASHGGVALGVTVLNESRGAGLAGAVLVLNLELVLEHDEITLTLLELHLLLEGSADGVQGVTAGG